MRRFPLFALSALLALFGSRARLCAQSGGDLWPGAFQAPARGVEAVGTLPCRALVDAVDLSSACGDPDLVGLAQDAAQRRWLVSGARGGLGAIWVFDSDAVGLPLPSTARALPAAPGAVGGFWKHRDGEWDPVSGLAYFGDEAGAIHELDPRSLRWTGRRWTLPGTAATTIRALACASEPALGVLRVFVADWTTPIEEWELDLVGGGARFVAAHPGNQGGLYGLSLVDGPGGVRSALVLFSQRPHGCASGRGRILLEVRDRSGGALLFSRAGDWRVGDSFFPEGGAAGGIQLASVGGQLVFAAVQQGVRDVLSAVPFQGFAAYGPPECDAFLRIEGAPRPGASIALCLAAPSAPQWGFLQLSLAPTTRLPLDCGELELGGGGIPLLELPLLTGPACLGPFAVPLGSAGTELVADALLFDLGGRVSSTNRLELLLARRCF